MLYVTFNIVTVTHDLSKEHSKPNFTETVTYCGIQFGNTHIQRYIRNVHCVFMALNVYRVMRLYMCF